MVFNGQRTTNITSKSIVNSGIMCPTNINGSFKLFVIFLIYLSSNLIFNTCVLSLSILEKNLFSIAILFISMTLAPMDFDNFLANVLFPDPGVPVTPIK